jgi:energy-dependent translational throttle protein EttA
LLGRSSGGSRERLTRLHGNQDHTEPSDWPHTSLSGDYELATTASCTRSPTIVVISHDRWFLDRIATHILAFEGDSQVRFFQGNVTDYEAFRRKELGTAADQPHRIRYKRLAAA